MTQMVKTEQGKAVTKQPTPTGRLKGLLDTPEIKSRFQEVLGNKAPAFTSSIVSALSTNTYLQKCEPMSIISSAMIAATLDLPINPSLGLAHIVPYKDVATFQMGWKGFVQLGMRSGQYKTMNATVVLEGEIEHVNKFTGDIKFSEKGATSDKKVGYLFYFKLLNGFEKYTYWTIEKCHEHGKRYSASFKKNYGPWVDDFDSMALKTVTKQALSKWGVLSIEMQQAIVYDEANGEGEYPDGSDKEATDAPKPEKKSRMSKIVEATIIPVEERNQTPDDSGSANEDAPI